MSTSTQSETYAKGLELAEQGCDKESLVYMQRHLQEHPNDAEALSDTGAVLFCLGETDQAVEHFKKAVDADNDYGQSYWNLAEAYLTDGKIQQASELFEDMQRLGILSPDLTIRTANHFLEQSDKGSAVEMILKSIELSDSEELLNPMIEVVKSKRPKIAFFGAGEIDAFYEYASKRFMTESFTSKNSDELPDLINWCDIAWFADSGENLQRALALPKVCKIVVKSNSETLDSESLDKIDKLLKNSDDSDNQFLNEILLELEKTIGTLK
jgi:tetratricopeptide (TPR) repeat protein